MVLKNYKKTLAVIGIMAILVPSAFLSVPKKAQAIVPVFDAAVAANTAALIPPTTVTAGATAALVKKDYILDTIAYAVAGQVLHALTQSIVTWIRSGFQGNPGFITDYQGFLTDAADQASGVFMKEFLSPEVYNAICSPFRPQLLIILKSRTTYRERMRCTLSTVIKNATDFSESLRTNGWQAWMSVSLNSQNDPHGALLITLDEQSMRLAKALGGAQTESIFNAGFIPMKKCVQTGYNDYTGETFCAKYENTSPGKWVSDTLGQATGIDMQRLAVADEINEILAALISQLLTGILKR